MALVQKQFGDLITFTRSSAGGRFNESGLFEMVPANQPRIDYDPVTKIPKGILIEEARTNLFLNSNKLGLMSKNLGATFAEESSIAPNGLLEAGRLMLTSNVSSGLYRFGVSANNQSTWSVFVRPVSGSGRLRLIMEGPAYSSSAWTLFDLNAGTFSVGAADVIGGMQKATGGWWRIYMTRPISNPGASHTIAIYSGEALEDKVFDVWMGQFEQGAFATTPIPTGATQVTRAADVVSVNVLTPWYNRAEGALIVKGSGDGLNGTLAEFSDGTSLNRWILALNRDAGAFAVVNNNVPTFLQGVAGPMVKIGGTLGGGNAAVSVNGAAAIAGANTATPVCTALRIGQRSNGTSPLNGHVQSIKYYPRRLTGAELQALTA